MRRATRPVHGGSDNPHSAQLSVALADNDSVVDGATTTAVLSEIAWGESGSTSAAVAVAGTPGAIRFATRTHSSGSMSPADRRQTASSLNVLA